MRELSVLIKTENTVTKTKVEIATPFLSSPWHQAVTPRVSTGPTVVQSKAMWTGNPADVVTLLSWHINGSAYAELQSFHLWLLTVICKITIKNGRNILKVNGKVFLSILLYGDDHPSLQSTMSKDLSMALFKALAENCLWFYPQLRGLLLNSSEDAQRLGCETT